MAGAVATMAAMAVACKSKVTNMAVYGGLGAALWFCLLKGGINADIAGVIAAFAIPAAAAAPAGSKVGRCRLTQCDPKCDHKLTPV